MFIFCKFFRDRKKKKFVRDDNDIKAKKMKTESGVWIPKTYKSDLYPLITRILFIYWKFKVKKRILPCYTVCKLSVFYCYYFFFSALRLENIIRRVNNVLFLGYKYVYPSY